MVPGCGLLVVTSLGGGRARGWRTGPAIAVLDDPLTELRTMDGCVVRDHSGRVLTTSTPEAAHALMCALNTAGVGEVRARLRRSFDAQGRRVVTGGLELAEAATTELAGETARVLEGHGAAPLLAPGLAAAADPSPTGRLDPRRNLGDDGRSWAERVAEVAHLIGAPGTATGSEAQGALVGLYRGVAYECVWTGSRWSIRAGDAQIRDVATDPAFDPLSLLARVIADVDTLDDAALLRAALARTGWTLPHGSFRPAVRPFALGPECLC